MKLTQTIFTLTLTAVFLASCGNVENAKLQSACEQYEEMRLAHQTKYMQMPKSEQNPPFIVERRSRNERACRCVVKFIDESIEGRIANPDLKQAFGVNPTTMDLKGIMLQGYQLQFDEIKTEGRDFGIVSEEYYDRAKFKSPREALLYNSPIFANQFYEILFADTSGWDELRSEMTGICPFAKE